MNSINSLDTLKILKVADCEYYYYSLTQAANLLNINLNHLPITLKILLENQLRNENDRSVTLKQIKALANWHPNANDEQEIAFFPTRVLMQDFTGVPAIVDLAAMREAMIKMGGDASKINPLTPVDLVIDHSVQVDYAGDNEAFSKNNELELIRNKERYEFLKWGQESFTNFRVVPPGTGICHQVNLEYLAKVVWQKETVTKISLAYFDSLVGTDSHTTMINGLGVLGWGVGGIEAEAAMLNQPISMLIPKVVGFKLTGKLKPGITATDLVLTITHILRKEGVVNKFVEFYGPSLSELSLADRATIANMAPEYGATCGFFPIDQITIDYLELSNRPPQLVKLVKEYAKAQGVWVDDDTVNADFDQYLNLDLSTILPSVAGPKRPQDLLGLESVQESFNQIFAQDLTNATPKDLKNKSVVIAAITSCTNTSNPSVMIAAALLAKAAINRGLNIKPWVKASFAPGSQVVSEYLKAANLQICLDQLGFNLVGYGCTTCIGNSGPLALDIEQQIIDNKLIVAGVLSGNRNFEGRIHPLVKANYLASPPLVIAYALAGTIEIDLTTEALGMDQNNQPVYLKDIWPSNEEIQYVQLNYVSKEIFAKRYAEVFTGDLAWQAIPVVKSNTYPWQANSTYIKCPPYFEQLNKPTRKDIKNARLLALFGDSITTDHISPAGNISKSSPAATYLLSLGVKNDDFNSYGARRGNHEVMMRGTFANIRIRNQLLPNTEGGITNYFPTNQIMSIYEAAMLYKADNTELIIIAGREYGTGSSRDWAAKGTYLLGVKAVIAESFERIHRSNLIGMGVLPLVFQDQITKDDLALVGDEKFSILGTESGLSVLMELILVIDYSNLVQKKVRLLARIDTEDEIAYLKQGGILPFVINKVADYK